MFKFNNNFFQANMDNYCKNVKNVHNYQTRSSETNFFLPRFNSKIGLELLSYQGSKLWTKLPLCLKIYVILKSSRMNLKVTYK